MYYPYISETFIIEHLCNNGWKPRKCPLSLIRPNLIKSGCLDSIIKQVIFESNIFNCEIKEVVNAYEERNIIAVPILAEIVAIRERRKTTGNLADEELRENELITNLNKANETLPTMDQLHAINRNKAGLILTEIQNGILTKVKTEQINLKKTVQNELKVIISKLNSLNMEVEKSNNETEKANLIETRETFYSKYYNFFRRQSEKMNLFKHINIEKPTKWFLNLTSDKMSQESPSAKLRKNGPKYEKYDETSNKTTKSADHGKKYSKKEELQEDMRQFVCRHIQTQT